MGSIFEHHTDALADYVKAFPPCDNQVGGIFVVANALFGLDVFDQPETFEAIRPKLVRSYAIDALEKAGESQQSKSISDAEAVFERLADAALEDHKAIGLGNDVSIVAEGLVASALAVSDTVVHLTAFSDTRRRYH